MGSSWSGSRRALCHSGRIFATCRALRLLTDALLPHALCLNRYYDGEDVSVGQWLSPLELTIVDEHRMIAVRPDSPAWQEHGCMKDFLSQHYVNPQLMVVYWQNEMMGRTPCAE